MVHVHERLPQGTVRNQIPHIANICQCSHCVQQPLKAVIFQTQRRCQKGYVSLYFIQTLLRHHQLSRRYQPLDANECTETGVPTV